MTLALGVKAPLSLSVFSAAGALLLGARGKFPLSLDELLQRNRQGDLSVADQETIAFSTPVIIFET